MHITAGRIAAVVTLLCFTTVGCQRKRAGVVDDRSRAEPASRSRSDITGSETAAPEVDIRSDLELGQLPTRWRTGGPDCVGMSRWQVHEYNPDFYILRQSGCVHYEKPFLYLIFGEERALLEDTGAGAADPAAVVEPLLEQWSERNGKPGTVPLTVVHSHSHGDHVAGDRHFDDDVEIVPPAVDRIQVAFGIDNWPTETGQIDLGDRVVDVIPIPGHDDAGIALYDRRTGLLLTGDSLYPGRIYVSEEDFFAFVEEYTAARGLYPGSPGCSHPRHPYRADPDPVCRLSEGHSISAERTQPRDVPRRPS